MEALFIPTLSFWENGNSWYGSKGLARFFIKPEKPEGEETPQLSVQLWRGPLCMDLSEILSTAQFPVSEEGIQQTTIWLEEQAKTLNEA